MKDVFGNQVFMAETDKVDAKQEQINRLLQYVGKYMGWGNDISKVWVSDMSHLGDFGLEDSELADLSNVLGFVVSSDDYLYSIAEKMRSN